MAAELRATIRAAERELELRRRRELPEAFARARRVNALRNTLAQLPAELRGVPRRDLVRLIPGEIFAAVHAWTWGDASLVLCAPGGAASAAGAYLVRRLCAAGAAYGGPAYERALTVRWCATRDLEGGAAWVASARLLVVPDAAPGAALLNAIKARADAGLATVVATKSLAELGAAGAFLLGRGARLANGSTALPEAFGRHLENAQHPRSILAGREPRSSRGSATTAIGGRR